MKFKDIETFPKGYYNVDVGLKYFEKHLNSWNEPKFGSPLILNPEWQRGHVWKDSQKIAFMEYFLKGGRTGRNLIFNCSSWDTSYNTPIYCVDGLQRITATLDFLNNRIKVFGIYFKDFEDFPTNDHTFHFQMLKIENKKQLLKIYLDLNSGGTPHNPKELKRIAEMLEKTSETETI